MPSDFSSLSNIVSHRAHCGSFNAPIKEKKQRSRAQRLPPVPATQCLNQDTVILHQNATQASVAHHAMLNGRRIIPVKRTGSPSPPSALKTAFFAFMFLSMARSAGASEEYDENMDANGAEDMQEEASASLSQALHAHSVVSASQYFVNDDNQAENKTVDVAMKFQNQACMTSTMNTIFNSTADTDNQASNGTADLTRGGKVKWTRQQADNSTAAIASLNESEFYRAVGDAAINPEQCVTSLSVETMPLPATQASIHMQALGRDVESQLADAHNEEVCAPTGEVSGTVTNRDGKPAFNLEEVECRPRVTAYVKPSLEELKTVLGEGAVEILTNVCINKMTLISEGIRPNSDVAVQVASTTEFTDKPHVVDGQVSSMQTTNGTLPTSHNGEMAESVVRSALRRCPFIEVSDVRATTDFADPDGEVSSSTVLTSHSLMQALDSVLKQGAENLPDVITLMDIDEVADYHPDISLVADIVAELVQRGVTVYAYASSVGSWLARVPGVTLTDDISDLVVRQEPAAQANFMAQFMEDAKAFSDSATPDSPSLTGQHVAALSGSLLCVAIAALGLGLFCKYRRHTGEQETRTMQPEEIALTDMASHSAADVEEMDDDSEFFDTVERQDSEEEGEVRETALGFYDRSSVHQFIDENSEDEDQGAKNE